MGSCRRCQSLWHSDWQRREEPMEHHGTNVRDREFRKQKHSTHGSHHGFWPSVSSKNPFRNCSVSTIESTQHRYHCSGARTEHLWASVTCTRTHPTSNSIGVRLCLLQIPWHWTDFTNFPRLQVEKKTVPMSHRWRNVCDGPHYSEAAGIFCLFFCHLQLHPHVS